MPRGPRASTVSRIIRRAAQAFCMLSCHWVCRLVMSYHSSWARFFRQWSGLNGCAWQPFPDMAGHLLTQMSRTIYSRRLPVDALQKAPRERLARIISMEATECKSSSCRANFASPRSIRQTIPRDNRATDQTNMLTERICFTCEPSRYVYSGYRPLNAL